MALRINLYHEVIRAKRQQQYDPLKLSMFGLAFVAVCMAGFYFVQLKRTSDARRTHSARKSEFDKLGPKQKEAEKKEKELTAQIELAEKLTKRMEKRVYWAPVFESIIAVIPPNVQLSRMSCDGGREKGGTSLMSIEGLLADQEPRTHAENLRKAIAEKLGAKYPNATATFRSLDDSTEHPVVDGKRASAVVFAISVNFKAEQEPTPAPAAPSKRIAKNEAPTP
jgi:Tfp pilus assembly protein PilN